MLHPQTVLDQVSEKVGYGVFAARDIPRGTITWALDPLDQVFNRGRVERLRVHESLLNRYTWLNGRGERILCWDFARFMNHDCEPNTLSPGGMDFEIAIRDIRAGEQITCDYGSLNLEEPFSCECRSSKCRSTVRPTDFDAYAQVWDRAIRSAFPHIVHVEQPLWSWVERHSEEIRGYARHPDTLASTLLHRFVLEPNAVGA